MGFNSHEVTKGKTIEKSILPHQEQAKLTRPEKNSKENAGPEKKGHEQGPKTWEEREKYKENQSKEREKKKNFKDATQKLIQGTGDFASKMLAADEKAVRGSSR
ncbi:hypothetical protein ccbrp13_31060 [Ktedonobacteria bacterium brp13]|nr:hypothetical protein ccbrp13_31060 [Ktedonobacteria bacterium brp13]